MSNTRPSSRMVAAQVEGALYDRLVAAARARRDGEAARALAEAGVETMPCADDAHGCIPAPAVARLFRITYGVWPADVRR